METRTCPHCGAQDYGTPFCVSCQRPFSRAGGPASPGPSPDTVGQPAGFFRRFFAFLFDLVLLSIVADLVGLSFSLGSGSGGWRDGPDVPAVISFVLFLLYFTLFTADGGQTPGKKLLGIRVVGLNSRDVTARGALIRAAGYILSAFFGTFLGFLWALWDGKKQAWHDKLAGTRVIKSR